MNKEDIKNSLFGNDRTLRRKTALLHLKDEDKTVSQLSKYVLQHEEILKLLDKKNEDNK